MFKDKQIKLLYLVNNLSFLASHRLNLIKRCRALDYEVHVVAPASPLQSKFDQLGCHFHAWELERKNLNPITEWRSIWQLLVLYRKIKPDLVHHVSLKPILYGNIAAKMAKIARTVNAISGLGASYIATSFKAKVVRYFLRYGFQWIGKQPQHFFIFQNKEDYGLFVEKRWIKAEQAYLIHGSGVCMQAYQPLPLPPFGPGIVLLASRLLVDKGVVEFVEVAQRLAKKNLRFILVGDVDPGNPASLTKQDIHAWVKTGFVEWWGYQHDMQDVFRRCHVVCLPSYREGSPRVLIEAAALARPIITTDVPGCRDLVEDGVNGYLVPAKNVEKLANAIEKIFQNVDQLATMGQRSRERVEIKYAETRVVQETFHIYDTLLMGESWKTVNSEK